MRTKSNARRQAILDAAIEVFREVGYEHASMAQAEIKTGERRIIDFLLSPIAQTIDEAGRER